MSHRLLGQLSRAARENGEVKVTLGLQAQAPREMPLAGRQIRRGPGGRLRSSLLDGWGGMCPWGCPGTRSSRFVEMAKGHRSSSRLISIEVAVKTLCKMRSLRERMQKRSWQEVGLCPPKGSGHLSSRVLRGSGPEGSRERAEGAVAGFVRRGRSTSPGKRWSREGKVGPWEQTGFEELGREENRRWTVSCRREGSKRGWF